jgi:hypothetical protein
LILRRNAGEELSLPTDSMPLSKGTGVSQEKSLYLNASRLILRHSNTVGGSSDGLQPDGLPWKRQSLIGSIEDDDSLF